jgi:hypothetical protein
MSWSRLSLLPILIASASLLSAASPISQPSPRPTASRQISQNNQEAGQVSNAAAKTAPMLKKDQARSTELPRDSRDDEIQSQLVTIEGRISDFTLWLVLVGVLQFGAAVFAACSARNSVEVAKLALQADRPYLLVERGHLDGWAVHTGEIRQVDNLLTEAILSLRTLFDFRNFGKGPAIIREAVILMTVVKELPPPKVFSDCQPLRVEVAAIPAGEPWNPPAHLGPPQISWPDHMAAIRGGTRRLIVYGRVKYEDLMRNSYETVFCWIYCPPRPKWRPVVSCN